MPFKNIFINSVFLLFIFVGPALALNVKSTFEKTRPSVVLIVAYDEQNQPKGIGSGFFFGDANTIATNFHVIANAAKLVFKLNDGGVGSISNILGLDRKNDLALLESTIAGKPLNASDSSPSIGESIIAIGNPKGLEGTVSTGIVSGIRTVEGSQYFQITAPISPGSSGGPIINEQGNVIGVATSYLDGTQNLNFSMPIAYVSKLYSKKEILPITAAKGVITKKDKVSSNVEIAFGDIGGIRSQGREVKSTIVNKSNYAIRNVKVLIKYFHENKEIPIHHSLHNFKDTVPPNLSLRVRVLVENVELDWVPKFTVLDYDIVKDTNSGGILTFD